MTTLVATPTAIVTSPCKFSASEKQRLTDASTELERLDQLLEKVARIKDVIDSAAEDFAAGRIDIATAAALLSASGDSSARAELEGKLRRPLKTAIKSTVATVADLIDKARRHHVSELASKAQRLEDTERGALATLGMNQGDFEPSNVLLGLREQHRRAAADAQQAPLRDSLNRLLVAALPEPAALDLDRELAADFH